MRNTREITQNYREINPLHPTTNRHHSLARFWLWLLISCFLEPPKRAASLIRFNCPFFFFFFGSAPHCLKSFQPKQNYSHQNQCYRDIIFNLSHIRHPQLVQPQFLSSERRAKHKNKKIRRGHFSLTPQTEIFSSFTDKSLQPCQARYKRYESLTYTFPRMLMHYQELVIKRDKLHAGSLVLESRKASVCTPHCSSNVQITSIEVLICYWSVLFTE